MLSQFLSLPLSDRLHPSLFKLSVACLTAGDMALWMGPGRKVLERIWEVRPALALDVTSGLSDLNWGGFKLLALPHVLKRTSAALDTDPYNTLEMLSSLQKDKRLESAETNWRQHLQAWVDTRFQDWSGSEEQARLLLPYISPSSTHLFKPTDAGIMPRTGAL